MDFSASSTDAALNLVIKVNETVLNEISTKIKLSRTLQKLACLNLFFHDVIKIMHLNVQSLQFWVEKRCVAKPRN